MTNIMKNLIKTSIAALLVFAMVTSCKKDQNGDVSMERQLTEKEMANEKNQFDKVGQQHNAYLDFFAKNSGDASVENLIKVSAEFYKDDKNDETTATLRASGEIYAQVQQEIQAIGGPYRPLDLCKRFPILCDIFKPFPGPYIPFDILNSSTGTSTDRTLKFIAEVKNMEAKVMETDMEASDKAVILGYYSTARHSAAYWHNNLIASKNNPWYNPERAAQFAKYPKDIIGADADGATIGGILGTGFGPWGTVIGGVVGGAGASIWAAVSKK